MKTRLMMLLACASALFAGALWADTEMAYGLVWTYSIVNGKAEIRNSSSTAVSPKPKKDLVIPVKLGGKPVAVIGANALSGCSDLTSVTIPSTVTTIEAGAFSSCTKLRSVKIPDAVTGIGESAFKGCSALQCVELGKKVNSIGATAFMNCGSLRAVVFRGVMPQAVGANLFQNVASGCQIYVSETAKNWPGPGYDWHGLPMYYGDYMVEVKVRVYGGMEAYGSVSGGGIYAVGKKVTLKATPAKGCVFAGWIEKNSSEELGYSASYSYTVTGADTDFCAGFATAAQDSDSLRVQMDDFTTAADGSVYQQVAVESLSEPKISFKNLPAGIKFDASKRVLTGKATKPGVYMVTISATNKSDKDPSTAEFAITVPNLKDPLIPVQDSYGPFSPKLIPGAPVIHTIDAAAGCKVTGQPPGYKWTDKEISVKNYGTVPANSFYGAATKSTSFTVFFTKTVNGVKHTATSTFTIDSFLVLTLHVDGSGSGTLATVAGAHPAFAKVALKAKADPGSVFAYWYELEGGKEKVLSKSANFTFEMGLRDETVFAKFITKEEDRFGVKVALDVLGTSYELEDSTDTLLNDNLSCGVYCQLPFTVKALSETTAKISGLPAGLKFTAKDIMKKGSKTEVEIPANTIYGVPTKAGHSFVKLQVTTAGKTTIPYGVHLDVSSLKPWAVGQFDGAGAKGPVTLAVTDGGKISGKYMAEGETWSFAAPYFDDYDPDARTYTATVSGKKGNATFAETLTIHEPATPMGEKVAKLSGDATIGDMALYQTFWKFNEWKAAGKAIDKKRIAYIPAKWTYDDTVYLTFSANGSVKTAGALGGYKASGTATLIPMEMPVDGNAGPFESWVYVYFPPNAKKGFPGYFENIHLWWDGEGFGILPKN